MSIRYARILRYLLIGLIVAIIVVVLARSFLWPRLYYALMLYMTAGSPIVSAELVTHPLPPPVEHEAYVMFGKIMVPTLPGTMVYEKYSSTSVRKIFVDKGTSSISIFRPTNTMELAAPSEIVRLSNSKTEDHTNYGTAKSIWSASSEDLSIWSASGDRLEDMYYVMLKGMLYADCTELSEFTNTFEVKGAICSIEGKNARIVAFLSDDTAYELWLLRVSPEIIDTVVSGIRPQQAISL